MASIKLTYYKNMLLSATQKVTNGKANIAKPILLLTFFKLIEEGHIIGNKILFDEQLISTYNKIFKEYAEVITNPEYPFYYLRNDGFYFIKGRTDKKTPSAKYLRDHCEYAYFDDGLWELLQEPESREELRNTIINHYLR